MHLSIRKIFFNKPWLLPILAFLTFVAIWMAFITFAVQNRPPEVERIKLTERSSTAH